LIRTLLNTLFVQKQGAYLRLDHDTVKVEFERKQILQVPLHHLGSIAVFGNVLVSPFLIHRCAKEGKSLVWLSEHGRFQANITGPVSSNVLLRKAQFEKIMDSTSSLYLAKKFIEGKVRGACMVLNRAYRDHGEDGLKEKASEISRLLKSMPNLESIDEVRGIEGIAASWYFDVFPKMLRASEFQFDGRVKRPPRDPVNAVLSFAYTLLASDCRSALETVGLDPQMGFLHALRPGRPALALDLMAELRAPLTDRLVLALFNRKQLQKKHFDFRLGGTVLLNEEGRKVFIVSYQKRKQEEVAHPLFKNPVPIGILPYIQGRLLARYIRNDLEEYVSYRWR